jgi:hypothetical protein
LPNPAAGETTGSRRLRDVERKIAKSGKFGGRPQAGSGKVVYVATAFDHFGGRM